MSAPALPRDIGTQLNPPRSALREDQARAIALIARHVNASTPLAMPDAEMLDALRSGVIPREYEHHVYAALDETDVETLMDLEMSGGVTFGQLASLADRVLPEGHDTRTWLDERRSC